jgi:hypothetical protein
MGFKTGVFFEMGGYMGRDLWTVVKMGDVWLPEGVFPEFFVTFANFF